MKIVRGQIAVLAVTLLTIIFILPMEANLVLINANHVSLIAIFVPVLLLALHARSDTHWLHPLFVSTALSLSYQDVGLVMTSPASHAILYTESMVHQVILSNKSATANCYPCSNISPQCIFCNSAFQCDGCTAGFVRDFSTCKFKIIFSQLPLRIMRCTNT